MKNERWCSKAQDSFTAELLAWAEKWQTPIEVSLEYIRDGYLTYDEIDNLVFHAIYTFQEAHPDETADIPEKEIYGSCFQYASPEVKQVFRILEKAAKEILAGEEKHKILNQVERKINQHTQDTICLATTFHYQADKDAPFWMIYPYRDRLQLRLIQDDKILGKVSYWPWNYHAHK